MASSVMIKSRGREFDNSSTAAPFAVSPQHPSPALSLPECLVFGCVEVPLPAEGEDAWPAV